MLNRIPRNIPALKFLLSELAITPKQAAKVLHVTERTIHNWLKFHNEPRSARIALFWLTRWGFSILDCEITNQIQIYAGLARAQADYIKRLENLSTFSANKKAANDAAFGELWTIHDTTQCRKYNAYKDRNLS